MMSVPLPRRIRSSVPLLGVIIMVVGFIGHHFGMDPILCVWLIVPAALVTAIAVLFCFPWRKPGEPQALHPLFHAGGLMNVISGAFLHIVPREEIAVPLSLFGSLVMFVGIVLSAVGRPTTP